MSTNTKWSHLPNAEHIDRILASVKSHPYQWSVMRNVIDNPAWQRAADMVYNKGRDKEWSAAWKALWKIGWNVGRGALLCLVAYDDCAYLLDSEIGELRILAAFGDPKAILLLPTCIVFHSTKNIS